MSAKKKGLNGVHLALKHRKVRLDSSAWEAVKMAGKCFDSRESQASFHYFRIKGDTGCAPKTQRVTQDQGSDNNHVYQS